MAKHKKDEPFELNFVVPSGMTNEEIVRRTNEAIDKVRAIGQPTSEKFILRENKIYLGNSGFEVSPEDAFTVMTGEEHNASCVEEFKLSLKLFEDLKKGF